MGENWGALQVTSYRICGPIVPLDSFPGFGILFLRFPRIFFLSRVFCLRRIQGIVGGLTDQLILMNCLLPTREESISRPTFSLISRWENELTSTFQRASFPRSRRARDDAALFWVSAMRPSGILAYGCSCTYSQEILWVTFENERKDSHIYSRNGWM